MPLALLFIFVYDTEMYSRADDDGEPDDEIGRLAVATECVRRRVRDATPESLRNDLSRLRRIIDRIELEFATVAGAFADTVEEEWQGCVSAPQRQRARSRSDPMPMCSQRASRLSRTAHSAFRTWR